MKAKNPRKDLRKFTVRLPLKRVFSSQNITYCHQGDDLRHSKARCRMLAENIDDLVCLHSVDGQLLYVSPSCEAMLGYGSDELIGCDFLAVFTRDFEYQTSSEFIGSAATGAVSPVPVPHRVAKKSGGYIWLETSSKAIINSYGITTQVQTISRDVTDRIQMQQQLKHLSLHDTLTNLPNRAFLMCRLEKALNQLKYFPERCCILLFLDLDHFKVINDSLGHLFGDQVLMSVADTLQSAISSEGFVARLGGDEFVVLLDHLGTMNQAIQLASQILDKLRSPQILEGREVFVSASVGIVQLSAHYSRAFDLLRDADIALYRAKQKGRDRYEVFDTLMHQEAIERLQLENDLRKAIDRNEFRLHYQPILCLETGQIAGFEALIRWQHPHRGLVSPDKFIVVAEETGLILPMGLWVLRQACEQIKVWQTRWPHLPPLQISVNLSGKQLQDTSLVAQVREILAATGLQGQHLTLELTESMLIGNTDTILAQLHQLKRQGIQLGIDDFGTGYSSLSYLHRLPIDLLKIDQSFVNRIEDNGKNEDIATTILALSQSLDLKTVAEGIETPLQHKRLRQMGCQFGQGYLFSPPLPADAIEPLLSGERQFPPLE